MYNVHTLYCTVQLDCPEDATTYTHRAGRTARYNQVLY